MVAPGPFFVDRGFGVLVLEQARALLGKGVHVEVVAYHSGRDLEDVVIHRTLPFPGYGDSKIGPSLVRIPLWFLLLVKTFLVARRTRPDVLHGHLHEGALISTIVSRLTGIPWVFDYQGSLTMEMVEKGALRRGSFPYRAVSFFEGFIDKRARRILVKSQLMQDDLIDRFGIGVRRIRRVMDGADPNTFAPREPSADLRRKLGIDESATVAGYIGLLTEQQGTELLLRATADVVRQRPDVHVLIIGYPTDPWVEQAKQLCIEKHVTFTGRIDHQEAADYLALSNFTVAPKISETEGNGKVYHYMSMELPVVAIDNVGNRELLGADGYFVNGHEPRDFARGMLTALDARDEWRERGKRLRQRIINGLSWNAVADRLIAAYRDEAPAAFGATE